MLAGLDPCGERLGRIHCLELVPRPHGIGVRRVLVRPHEVGDEIDVAAVLDAQRPLLRLVEPDSFLDQIAVRNPPAAADLRFAPAVEQVTRARGTFEPGSILDASYWMKSLVALLLV